MKKSKVSRKEFFLMSDTLYLQLDQNIEVTNPHVYLQDIAALSMSDPKILNRLRVMPVMVLDETKPGRYVMSVIRSSEKDPEAGTIY